MKIIKVSQQKNQQESLWNLSDSWQEDLDYLEELGLSLETMLQMHGINYEIKDINNNKIFIVYDETMYISEDYEDDSYPTFKEAQEWIDSMWDMELDSYIPDQEDDFWEYPSTLYHATAPKYGQTEEELIQSIKRVGLLPKNESRGMSNRGMAAAVFTSTNPEEISSYGHILVEINTEAMKNDGYNNENMPVSGESPLEESRKKSSLAWAIGFDDYIPEEYGWEGYSEQTIALYGIIPPKYLTIII